MALTNQATISLAVNIKNLAKVESLTKAFNDLRTTVIAMQRSTQGVSGMAKAIRAASAAAAEQARNQERAKNVVVAAVAEEKRALAGYNSALKAASRAHRELSESEKEAARWSEQFDQALMDATGHSRAFTAQLNRQDRAVAGLVASNRQLNASRSGRGLMSKGDWNREFNAAIREQTQRLRENQRAKRDAERAAAALARKNRENEKAIRNEAAAIARANAIFNEHIRKRQELIRVANEQRSSLRGRLQRTEEELDAIFRAGFRLQMVGQDLKYLGTRIKDALSDVLDSFGKFEFMANRAAGALQVPEDKMRDLQTAIMDTSEELRLFQPEETAKALYYLASTTGQSVDSLKDIDNIMNSLVPIMKAAALTETDYETAIKGTYSVLVQYNGALVEAANASGDYSAMTAKMTDITQKLFYVAQRTAAEFPDLVNSFKMVGPVAAQAGATFEDIVDLLGRLADVGIRGTMSGRALRQMFIQMVRPSKQASKALEYLFQQAGTVIDKFRGRSYKEIMFPDGEFVGTQKYIENLALAVKDLSFYERQSLLAKISTANELPILNALVAQESRRLNGLAGSYSKTGDAATKAAAMFDDSWKKLSQSWMGLSTGVQVAIENLKIAIGREFATAFKEYMEKIGAMVKRLREWVEANPEVVQAFGKIAAAASAALVVFGLLATAAGSMIALAAGIKLVITAFRPLFGTIGGATVVITAFVDSILKYSDELVTGLQDIQRALQDVFKSVASDGDDAISAIENIYRPFKAFTDMVVKGISDILPLIASLIRALDGIGALGPTIQVVSSALGVLFSVRLIQQIGSFGKGLFAARKQMEALTVTMMVNGEMRTFTRTLTAADLALQGTSKSMWTFSGMFSRLSGSVRPASGAMAGMSSAISGVASIAKGAVSGLMGFLTGPVGMLILGTAFVAAENNWLGFGDLVKGITDRFRDMRAEANSAIESFGDLSDLFKQATYKAVLPGIDDAIKGVDTLTAKFDDINNLDSRGTLSTTFLGKEFSVPVVGQTPHALEASRSWLKEEIQKWRDSTIADLQKAIDSIKNEINPMLLARGEKAIDLNALMEEVLNVSKTTSISPTTILAFYKNVFSKFGTGASKAQIQSYLQQYVGNRTQTGMVITQAMVDSIADNIFDPAAVSQALVRSKIDVTSALYQPIADQILIAMSNSDPDEVARLLGTAPSTMVGGMVLPIAETIAGADPDMLKPELRQIISNALSWLPPELRSMMMDTIDAGFAGLAPDPELVKFSDFVTKTVEKMMDTATEKIGSVVGTLDTYSELSSKISIGLKRGFLTVFGDVQRSALHAVERFAQTDFGNDAEMTRAFQIFMVSILPTGETLKEALASGHISEGLGAIVSDILEQGVRLGKIPAEVAKEIAGDVNDNVDEAISAVVQTLEGRKSVVESLRKRLKSKKNDVTESRKLIRSMFSGLLTRASRRGAPIGIRQDATEFLDSGTEGIVTLIENSAPKVRTKIMQTLARNLRNIKWGKLSGKQREAAFDLATFLNPMLKNPIKIPKDVQRQFGDNVNTAINTAVETGITGPAADNAGAGAAAANPVADAATSMVKTAFPLPEDTYAGATTAGRTIGMKIASALHSEDVKTSMRGAGIDIATSAATGFSQTMMQYKFGQLAGTVAPSLIAGHIQTALSKGWYTRGAKAGQSWADGLNNAIIANVNKTLTFVADVTVGESPPKKGPLSKIDKGGQNIGKAWGANWSRAAIKEVHNGVARARNEMEGRDGRFNAEISRNDKRTIVIDLNVKGEGSIDRSDLTTIRKGLMDALVLADLAHMVTVR